jgi:anti-anti-sigma factor
MAEMEWAEGGAGPGTLLLRLSDELDLADYDRISEEIHMRSAEEHDALVVDLTGLEFMDSSGVRLLVAAHAECEGAGRRFAVVAGDGPVRRILEMLQVHEVLRVVSSVEELSSPPD